MVRTADGVELTGADGTLRVRGPIVARPVAGQVRIDDTTYRGAALVRPAAEGVTAVNLVELETYLLGVVPREIGGGRPPEELEAVKAQAIAARTYAVRQLGRRDALGFDYYGSVLDQVYGGMDAEDETTTRAVRETRGEVVVHDGEPIEAYYHSTCGGRTAALEEVWGGEPRPYLRSVSDRRPDGGWYCESSNRFRWTEHWTHDELLATLTAGLRERGEVGAVTRVESLEVTGRTRSGRAEALRVATNL
ncbi:MAG: SpoIID/LytB domain-containing protein, partial [Gemmatimonadetes bacterium]|nr:SpoIID/LytB domain-containing protein [Gemmatimonadota bacterium]NIQ59704.1 SpoIID/LytB domain-containing protein [Gemmatimonadota bacterium]NIU79909.1 SpoIID/LytB domain-containing protein [Gammaproteobacteria bacterium]NIX48388.1 SpoIID/LytB domain-containing protein [Gemmatimonadota bacterium]NIY12829.1 SpoIID/LytB domain-containing protein [Gemmatimonadota bacterium]